MLTNRDIEILIYIQSKGKIVKYGNDPHPYDIPELNELTKLNLLTCTDHTMPAPKGDHPPTGNAYTLTKRGDQIVKDWGKSNAEDQESKQLAKKTYSAAKISIVIAVLSLISSLILSILSLIF